MSWFEGILECLDYIFGFEWFEVNLYSQFAGAMYLHTWDVL
jgi:hypothetical protein